MIKVRVCLPSCVWWRKRPQILASFDPILSCVRRLRTNESNKIQSIRSTNRFYCEAYSVCAPHQSNTCHIVSWQSLYCIDASLPALATNIRSSAEEEGSYC